MRIAVPAGKIRYTSPSRPPLAEGNAEGREGFWLLERGTLPPQPLRGSSPHKWGERGII